MAVIPASARTPQSVSGVIMGSRFHGNDGRFLQVMNHGGAPLGARWLV